MTHFTQEDLRKLGLTDNGDGSFSKNKVILAKITNLEFESGMPIKKNKKQYEPVYFKNMDIQDLYKKCEEDGVIFIHGNVPSSKNNKQLFKNSKTGKTFITSSERCKKYVKDTEIHYKLFKSKFHELIQGKDKPYRIEFTFVRDSKHKADFHNLVQLPMDIMVSHGWLEDDNMSEVLPFPGLPGYDPKLSGMIIKII